MRNSAQIRRAKRKARKARALRLARKARGGTIAAPRVPRIVYNDNRLLVASRQEACFVFDLDFAAPAATVIFPYSLEYIIATNPNVLTVSSSAVPGYTAMKTLYRKYRVFQTQLRFSLANNEAFPVEMFACPVNFVPSLVTSPVAYFSQPGCQTKLVSAKGGLDNHTLVVTASPAKFGGSASTSVEDAYVGTTDNTSPPSDNYYFLYGFNTNGLATVSGVTLLVRIHVWLEFFELQSPVS